jgi:hypothetical protein
MNIITRQEAKAQGLKRYYTGLACKYGHVSERLVSNKTCCQCALERSQQPDVKVEAAERKKTPEYKAKQEAYYKANTERYAAQQAEYRKLNTERIATRKAAYYAANTERFAARNAAYQKANTQNIAAHRKANPHISNAQNAARRAAKLQATPRWANFEAIKEVYRQCAERTRLTGEKQHVDHIYPLISDEVCGLHVAANLQILSASDNLKKSNKFVTTTQIN